MGPSKQYIPKNPPPISAAGLLGPDLVTIFSDLLKSALNTSVSGVKYSWTALYRHKRETVELQRRRLSPAKLPSIGPGQDWDLREMIRAMVCPQCLLEGFVFGAIFVSCDCMHFENDIHVLQWIHKVTHLLADLGWVGFDMGFSTGRWAVLQMWCCPSKTVEHPKPKSFTIHFPCLLVMLNLGSCCKAFQARIHFHHL